MLIDTAIDTIPTLTMELYLKWYGLQLIHPDGCVEELPFPGDEYAPPGESAFRDHVPNPKAVENYALEHGYAVGEFALELITGRWYLETT